MGSASEVLINCSKETRRELSQFKQSPETWDDTLSRLAEIAREHEGEEYENG